MRIDQVNGHSVVADRLSPQSLVYDLGANVGAFAKDAHRRYGVSTVSVEPNTDLHSHLAPPAISRVIGELVTVDGRDVTFSISENTECSSILASSQSPIVATKTLPSVSFRDLLPTDRNVRIDWMKMDIEGVEIEVLQRADADDLLRIDQLSVEFHESNGLSTLEEVLSTIERMRSLGFRVHRGSLKDLSDVLFLHPEFVLPPIWALQSQVWKWRNGMARRVMRGRSHSGH